MTTTEQWRKILGFNNYSVSDMGRIRNDKTNRIIRVSPNVKNGYLQTVLTNDDGQRRGLHPHRAVAEAFLPNPEKLPTVDHIFRNKHDNRASMLRWADWETQRRNTRGNPFDVPVTLDAFFSFATV